MSEPIIFRAAQHGASRPRARFYIESEDKPFTCSYPPLYRRARAGSAQAWEHVPGRYERDRLSFAVGGSIGYRVQLTREAIDGQLRHVRPQELAELERIDEKIALLQVQRREAVERAWQKGHIVTKAELEQRANARLAAVEATRRELASERRREAAAARVED